MLWFSLSTMATNVTVTLIEPCQYLTDEENLQLQDIIQEETIRSSRYALTNKNPTKIAEIYVKVKKLIANRFKHCIDKLDSTIINMIEIFLQNRSQSQKRAIQDSEDRAKWKNNRGVYIDEEITVECQYAWEQSELRREQEEEMKQVIQLSKEHHDDQTEFEKRLNETLAKSYEEEKSKLLALLVTDNIGFDILANQLNKILSGEHVVVHKGSTMSEKSALILAIIETFEHDWHIINTKCFQSHINTVHNQCMAIDSTVVYDGVRYQIDPNSTFNIDSINDYLVNIQIKGDGNCLWSSVSHSLFGDYSMMKSLRLLTAVSLTHYFAEFSEALRRQTSQFNYNHALTLEQLIKESVSLQSWGDEFHIMALSLALKRPIYSYGSLNNIPEAAILGYEEFRRMYELEHIPNHFKYIGNTNDANKEPILLHYDGNSHYSAVLKRLYSSKPLVPFIQIIDPLFGHQENEIAKPDRAKEIDDDDSSIEMDLEGKVDQKEKGNVNNYTSVRDNVEQNDIAKLKNILVEKDKLLQQYETFYHNVKKMIDDEKDDMGLLKTFVKDMEDSRL